MVSNLNDNKGQTRRWHIHVTCLSSSQHLSTRLNFCADNLLTDLYCGTGPVFTSLYQKAQL